MAKKDIRLNGSVELQIHDHKFQVDIKFTKNSDGEEWTGEKIVALLKENDIVYGYKEEDIAQQLKIAGEKSSTEVVFATAKADPPVETKPEEANYAQIDIPEELAPHVEEKISNSAQPSITREIVNKIEKSRTITKKAALPFMPAKEETEKYFEEERKTEKVYIDPTVESLGYVRAGQLIAQIHQVATGSPGKNIYGDVVQPKAVPDPYFYNGKFTSKNGFDIRSDVTGIVRKGTNWVDVVPFRPHEFTIYISEDRATCMLSLDSGDPLIPPPSVSDIKAKIEELEYPLDRIIEDSQLETILAEAVERGEGIHGKPISGSQDAFFEINVSEDQMNAQLTVRKGKGEGRQLVLKEVGSAINKSGIIIPDKNKLKEDILNFYRSSELELREYQLAEGKEAKKGADQAIDWSARFLDEKEYLDLKKEIEEQKDLIEKNEDGTLFPMGKIDALAYVEREQRLVTIGPILNGDPGVDVYGNSVAGLPGRSYQFILADSVEQKGNIIIANRAGLLERAQLGDEIHLRVRPRRDSRIQVEISEDRLEARVSIDPGEGSGAKLSPAKIQEGIEAAGVTKGFIQDVLQSVIERAMNGEKIESELIARGQAPDEGKKESIEYLIQLASDSKVKIRQDGSADYKNTENMTRVSRDQAIARITPPDVTPKPGFDVSGRELTTGGEAGLNLQFGEHIRQDNQTDGTIILYSKIDGELVNQKGVLDVLSVHTVQGNVGLDTGNIKFAGTVQVAGNVESGFFIMSNADIKIKGSIDRALLSAGGNILIQGGVKGGGKALLRSKGNIMAAFVEQSTLLSVENIKIQKSCFRSNVKCNGILQLGDKSTIVGGNIKVKFGLETTNLGSEKGVPTKVHFGQDYLVEDQIHVQEKEIKKAQLQIAETDAALQKAAKSQEQDKLRTLFTKKTKLLKLIEKRSFHLFNLKEQFERHFESKLLVKGTLYPGVILESHGREFEVRDAQKNVVISFNTELGRIQIEPAQSGQKGE